MAEVNGTDHLVRHDKETKLNGYDNEGFHSQGRSEDEESASDEDRLRIVVTENGHRPEDDSHLHNGYAHDEPNGQPTTVNGTAVIVLEDGKGDCNMEDKSDSSQKPLDTRLHHYVPVDDIDRKILNGSDGTHVTIPEDAVISFTTGRVKVKRGASNNPQMANERESIPLETMLPSYEAEDKTGLGEKAELEAELSNHKNGLWSEGHNAYANPEGPFVKSEKLNGTSKSSDEVSLPVNNHRKCLSNDVSDTSSEQKSTGEKLYFTEDNRKLCPGWRRVFVCGLILIILAVALLLGVLAATGILLAESESKNTRYESGHSLPSIDTISHAGHSFRPRPSPKVPQKFLPPVTEDPHLLPNATVSGVEDAVSPTSPPTVSSKVPLLNDTSHSQTIVPNALVGEFTILDENFTEDLKDNSSLGYISLATPLESELRRIFKRNGGVFQELKILNFRPGSIKVKFVTVWSSDRNILLSDKAAEMVKSYLRKKNNSFLAFPVDMSSIHFMDVFDECRVQKGGCSFKCSWDYNTLLKTCICEENKILLKDGKSCGPKTFPSSSVLSTSEIPSSPSTTSTSTTGASFLTSESSEITTKYTSKDPSQLTTTQIPTTLAKALTTVMEIVNAFTTAENSMKIDETTTSSVRNLSTEIQSLTSIETATSSAIEQPTTVNSHILTDIFTTNGTEIIKKVTTEEATILDDSVLDNAKNYSILEEVSPTENLDIISNISLTSISNPEIKITLAENSTTSASQNSNMHTSTESYTVNSELENANFATGILPTTEPYTNDAEDLTTIGYHIKNETFEIYTLAENTDFVNETTESSSSSYNVNNNSTVATDTTIDTSPETILLNTGAETIMPEHVTEPVFPTEVPIYTVSEISESNTTVEEPQYDTTESVKYDNITEVPNVTDAAVNVDNLKHLTTIKYAMLDTVTDSTALKDISINDTVATNPLSETDAISTTPISLTDLKSTGGTSAAEVDYATSIIPPVIPQLNRTPEVRLFDNFTDYDENNTFVPTIDLSTNTTLNEASTEENTDAYNLSTTELEVETTSPVTTPISTIEPLMYTTVPASTSVIIADIETSSKSTDLSSENKPLSSTETTIPAFNETMPAFDETTISSFDETAIPAFTETTLPTLNGTALASNFSLGDTEVFLDLETTLKLTTESHPSVTVSDTIANDTLVSTITFNEAEISTVPTFDKINSNDTFVDGTTVATIENNEAVLNEHFDFRNTTDNYPEVTSISSFNHSDSDDITVNPGPDTFQTFPSTEIEMNFDNDTTHYDNKTSILELSDATSMIMESNSSMTTDSSNVALESSNFTEFPDTANSLSVTTTLETMLNETNYPEFINNTTTVTPITTLYESNITTGEINDNTTYTDQSSFTDVNETEKTYTVAATEAYTFPTPTYFNESDVSGTTESVYGAEMLTTLEYTNGALLPEEILKEPNVTTSMPYQEEMHTPLLPGLDDSLLNVTLSNNADNFTTDGYEDVTNETTTNATIEIECREDQFLCEPLNTCINFTFMCDGIVDCPDGQDEYECKDTCHSNFMCLNSSMCIMNDARCDGIWDCENGTDEDNCTPTECAKHEVMCLDGSKCIKPGHICDWKYNCRDRSDEVGCVERTTCESGGRFFCNDGLCIPWALKCDGESDCKDGEDEGNCTCLRDEFRCNDGKCLKSSSRCDGHQDCHDAGDEMGCVNVDSEYIATTYEPYSGTWALLCAEDWTLDDGQYLCQELGFGHILNAEKVHVSFNGTWMAMRRDNLTETSLWTERVSFVESCTSSLAARVECERFTCGNYTGLLHRRRRDVVGSSATLWPFIGYATTFTSSKGCMSEILTPIWLITSTECLLSISKEPFNGSDWYIRTNLGNDMDIDLAQNHEVLKIITHPHSSKFRSLTVRDYDLALIRLRHALVFVPDKIGAICPPDEQVPSGITCFSGVLGTEKPRAPPPQTLAINSLALQIIDRKNCNTVDHFNNTINNRMLCTQSSEGHTICDNDEGTPLMCLTGINKWFLAGMLTYQRYCDVYNKHPAVFSNLFPMRRFLDQVIGQKQYQIPYDSSVYIIIPPTTPSPTTPETTTAAMTTTDIALLDTTYPFTSESENARVTMHENIEEIGSTTVFNEEFAREEDVTTLFPGDFTTLFSNTTINAMYENDTVPVHHEMEFDVFNSTMKESEISEDEFAMNKTHNYLMSLPNATDYDSNITDTFENTTDLSNNSYSLLDVTTLPYDFKNASVDINASTEFSNFGEANGTTLISADVISSIINKTKDSMPLMAMRNETVPNNQSQILSWNDSKDFFMYLNETDSNQPSISIFNDTMSKHQPNILITNESIAISQPLVSLINDTVELEAEPFATLFPSQGNGKNNTEITARLLDVNDAPVYDINSTMEIATVAPEITTAAPKIITIAEETTASEKETTGLAIEAMTVATGYAAVAEETTTVSIEGTITVRTENAAEVAETVTMATETISVLPETKIRAVETATVEPETIMMTVETVTTEPETITVAAKTASVESETSTVAAETASVAPESTTVVAESIIRASETATITPEATTIAKEMTTVATSAIEMETAVTSNMRVASVETETKLPATDSLFRNEKDSFSFEMEGEPNDDLAFSIFNHSDGLKFEPYALAENNKTGNGSGEYIPISEIRSNTNFTTPDNVTLLDNTTLPAAAEYSSNPPELTSVINNNRENSTTDLKDTDSNFTTPAIFEIETKSEIILQPGSMLNDSATSMPELELDTGFSLMESILVKKHLVSNFTFVQDNSSLPNITDCGLWNDNPDEMNNSNNESFFVRWPAVGFLQMVSQSTMCASVVLSPKFVITSLNCLSSSDNQLDPDKWAYVGGLYQPDIPIGGFQNHSVTQIIPYPDRMTPLLFYDHDMALVKLKDTIKMDKYSRKACIPEEAVLFGKECYTAGWSKNVSDDNEMQFYSIPMSIISNEECNNTGNYKGMLQDSLICGRHDSMQACQMDLGSPLFCLNENMHWEIQGILNFPGPCDMAQPTVFNSIASVRNWITGTLGNDSKLLD